MFGVSFDYCISMPGSCWRNDLLIRIRQRDIKLHHHAGATKSVLIKPTVGNQSPGNSRRERHNATIVIITGIKEYLFWMPMPIFNGNVVMCKFTAHGQLVIRQEIQFHQFRVQCDELFLRPPVFR